MSKSKGSSFERWACSELSRWWSGGDPSADLFWRTAGSGGRSTNRKKRGKSSDKHCGDVCAIDPAGEALLKVFTIELKRGYSKFSIQDLLDSGRGSAVQKYAGWCSQAAESCENANSLSWMIIAKKDRRVPLVILPTGVVEDRLEAYAARPDDVMEACVGGLRLTVIRLQDFFDTWPVGVVEKLAGG